MGRDDRAGWQASLPPRWLNDRTYRSLTPHAWTLFTWTLAWGVDQENDGVVAAADLPFIAAPMLSHAEAQEAATELVAAGLFVVTDNGFAVSCWDCSQPAAAEMEAKRAKWRSANARRAGQSPPQSPTPTTPVVAEYPPRNRGAHVRTDEVMDARSGEREPHIYPGTGEAFDEFETVVDMTGWDR